MSIGQQTDQGIVKDVRKTTTGMRHLDMEPIDSELLLLPFPPANNIIMHPGAPKISGSPTYENQGTVW